MLMSGKFCRMQNMVAVRGAPSGAPVFLLTGLLTCVQPPPNRLVGDK